MLAATRRGPFPNSGMRVVGAWLALVLVIAILSGSGFRPVPAAPVRTRDLPPSLEASTDRALSLPVALPPRHIQPWFGPSPAAVSPTRIYSSEPAPMGIGDFGVGYLGNSYTYNSSEFLGTFSWRSLSFAGTQGSSFGVQLNVVLQFVQDGTTYAYWIQDVAFAPSGGGGPLWFEDNIWNFTTPSSCLDNSAVQGSGTVYPYAGCQGYYAVVSGGPGSGQSIPSSGQLQLRVQSHRSASGLPAVGFMYGTAGTSGFVTFDDVTWPWATHVSSYRQFLVDGSQYTGYNSFYDAELVLGGYCCSYTTAAQNPTRASSQLTFWNGHNFQAPPSVWNFGSDTAETVSNIQSVRGGDVGGTPWTVQMNGTAAGASPSQTYTQNQVGTLQVAAPTVPSGTVALGSVGWAYVGGQALFTLNPGTYPVWVNSSSSGTSYFLGLCTVSAGATLSVTATGGCTPSTGTPTASPPLADVGQSVTFQTALLRAGSGGDTFSWSVTPTGLGCGASTTATLSCVPTKSGTYQVTVTVTDSLGHQGTSGILNYTVYPALAASPPTASPSTIETGGAVSFAAVLSGGAPPYTFTWNGLPGPCSVNQGSAACRPGSAGTYAVSVRIVDATGSAVTSPALAFVVGVGPSLSTPYATPPGPIDLGQSVTFRTNVSGGSGAYTFSWPFLPAGCVSANASTVACTPTSSGTFLVQVAVSDTGGGYAVSASTTYVIQPDPSVLVTASPGSVDLGQAVLFSAVPSGGLGPYSYAWSGLPSGCSDSGTASVSCTPAALGTSSVRVAIVDSNGVAASSPLLDFVVYSAPVAGGLSASRSSLDVGQNVTFSVSALSGGTGVFAFAWTGLPTGCTSASRSTLVCTPTGPGTGSVAVTVTDSNGWVLTPGALPFTVFSDPATTTPQGSPPSIDLGQSVLFSTNTTGGSGGSTFTWIGLPSGCASSNATSIVCAPSEAGIFSLTVSVRDSNGFSARSGILTYTVQPALTVGAVLPSRASADEGQALTLQVAAAGGSGTYAYAWTGLPPGCVGSSTSLVTCASPRAGNYSIAATVQDSNGGTSSSALLAVRVYPLPTVGTPTATPSAPLEAQRVALSVFATPGSGSLAYTWSGLPPGCVGANASTITCEATVAGTYPVQVAVRDSNGGNATSPVLRLTVAPSYLGLPAVEGYALLGGLIIGVVAGGGALVALVLGRRRKARTDRSSSNPTRR